MRHVANCTFRGPTPQAIMAIMRAMAALLDNGVVGETSCEVSSCLEGYQSAKAAS